MNIKQEIKQEIESMINVLYEEIKGKDISVWIKAITRYETRIIATVSKLIQCLSTINEIDSVLLYAALAAYLNNRGEESILQAFLIHLFFKYPESEYPDVHVYVEEIRVIIHEMFCDEEIA